MENSNQIDLYRNIKNEIKRNKRAKVQRDLKVIRDRRKYKNPEVFAAGAFEKLTSNNIWQGILSYLTDISDVNSAFFACPRFKSLLRGIREVNVILSLEVAKIIEEEGVVYNFCMGTLKKYFLESQEVSELWKKAEDRQYCESLFHGDSWYLRMSEKIKWNSTGLLVFNNIKAVEHALANPILPTVRGICVREIHPLEKDDDLEVFYGLVSQFLESHGETIWLLEYNYINISRETTYLANGYLNLWHMVSKTPNLKALILNHITSRVYYLDIPRNEIVSLEEMLITFSFPKIKSLEYLHVLRENESVLVQIYENCTNLKSVINESGRDRSSRVWGALENLNLECYLLWSANIPNLIIHFEYISWPIRVLDLGRKLGERGYDKTSVLWPILNKFGATLENLKIDFTVTKDDDDYEKNGSSNSELYLPVLKTLDLGGYCDEKSTVDLDDFIYLKSINEISIRIRFSRYHNPPDQKKVVQVMDYISKMEHSNVWKLFPNLKKFTLFHFGANWRHPMSYIRRGSTMVHTNILGTGVEPVIFRKVWRTGGHRMKCYFL